MVGRSGVSGSHALVEWVEWALDDMSLYRLRLAFEKSLCSLALRRINARILVWLWDYLTVAHRSCQEKCSPVGKVGYGAKRDVGKVQHVRCGARPLVSPRG